MRRYRPTADNQRQNHTACRRPRRGAIIVLAAFLMILMMAVLALSIDTGYMYTMQSELDRAVDSAALAGAGALIEGTDVAEDQALEYMIRNPVGGGNVVIDEDAIAALKAQFMLDHGGDFELDMGHWNATTGSLTSTNILPSAVEVTMRYPNLPLFFGKVLGKGSFDIQSSATAMFQPRDIVLVLDLSGSMNDDSEFRSIRTFGKEAIMEGLEGMYQELGEPTYGIMQFDPQYITVEGAPPSSPSMPQNAVEYRYKSVEVTSTKDLKKVELRFSNGRTQTFSSLSGTTRTFAGTGRNSGKVIYRVRVKTDTYNSYETFDFSSSTIRSTIKAALGLNGVSYPYNSGSWESFIDYCRNDSDNRNADFKYMFGYANLINYWLERKPSAYQTEDLWMVSAQPITAVKDSVDVFMEYITYVDTNDRLGLAVYNASDGDGELEIALTDDLLSVADLARHRQAGHYHSYTNIGAGMETARKELEDNGRAGAFKMIVLMTDGRANWNNGRYSTTAARNHVISEAYAAFEHRYPIVTISLGAGADTALMDRVAEITESKHFNIPGGQAVGDYREDLIQVFRDIADARPLKLVH